MVVTSKSDKMFTRLLISCCVFATVLCAPVNEKISGRRIDPASTAILPDINQPDLVSKKSLYELRGGGQQGDMIFPNGYNMSSILQNKGVAIFGPHRWPNSIIPYDISSITSIQHRNFIQQAMNTLMYAVGTPVEGQMKRKGCVYFRPRQKKDRKFFKIHYGPGCSATVGYWTNSPSTMELNHPGCFYSGTIQHELMHILGFYHEQSRPDRDKYITVNYANIQRGQGHNFEKFEWDRTVLDQNTTYDLQSIMHYAANAFSFNGRPTITPKKSNVVLGQRDQLSEIDITEIRDYYGC